MAAGGDISHPQFKVSSPAKIPKFPDNIPLAQTQ